MKRAVIIDDNKLAIASLKADVEDHCPNVEIVGQSEGVIEAAKLLKDLEADILFLDIHMNNGTGFDLLDILDTAKYQVIFTTASPDFAIKAFQYAAIDYLLKPIEPQRLIEAVSKVKQGGTAALDSQQITMLKEIDTPEKIVLSTTEEIRIVEIKEIIRLESSNNYTTFYLEDGSKILVSKTLKEYSFLNEAGFYRVHQSHQINLSKVQAYIKTEGGYILMKDESRVPVSVRKKAEVMKALQKEQ